MSKQKKDFHPKSRFAYNQSRLVTSALVAVLQLSDYTIAHMFGNALKGLASQRHKCYHWHFFLFFNVLNFYLSASSSIASLTYFLVLIRKVFGDKQLGRKSYFFLYFFVETIRRSLTTGRVVIYYQ